MFHGDEEVTRYTPWPTRDRARTHDALTRRIGQRQAAAAGEAVVLAVEEIDSGTVIGEALLLREADDEAVLGYAIRRDRWGRGLATEAASTLVDAGFQELGLRRASAVVVPANVASIEVLRKLGFTPVSETVDRATFELTAERWRVHRARHPAAG
ncbi:GNAT family N-acetyltransferase [Kineococcus sp. TRM81007]|nr:GNAT family N-acetyltransferase [Kineococcus sp. TRM81007]